MSELEDKTNEFFDAVEDLVEGLWTEATSVLEHAVLKVEETLRVAREKALDTVAATNDAPEDAGVEKESTTADDERREHVALWIEVKHPYSNTPSRLRSGEASSEWVKILEDNIRSWDAEFYDGLIEGKEEEDYF